MGATPPPGPRPAHRAAEAAARRSHGRLLAWIASRTRDVAAAEDALAEAFAAAVETWPSRGVPDNPEGWLATVARRRLIGGARHAEVMNRAAPALAMIEEERLETGETGLPDRRLELMFACAHPAIDARMHAPLMLQCVLGLDAAAIARAAVVAPATMGQRLSRAKAKIRAAGIPFRVPSPEDLPSRLPAVLDAVYAGFLLGWDASAPQAGAEGQGVGTGPDGDRSPDGDRLTGEALWLAGLVNALMPDEAEALGLEALMRFSLSRGAARRDGQGRFVPLDAQDTRLWDGAMIAAAQALLGRAARLRRPGRFQIEAAIQSVHADRARTGATDWAALRALYAMLWQVAPTLSTLCGQAAVTLKAGDPAAALARLDMACDGVRYQPWWAVRAEALRALSRPEEATEAARCAAGMARDPAVRDWLIARSGPPRPL